MNILHSVTDSQNNGISDYGVKSVFSEKEYKYYMTVAANLLSIQRFFLLKYGYALFISIFSF